MKKTDKINTESQNGVELVSNNEVVSEFGEAMASVVSTDSVVTWAKFILTDDKPNENRQRVPAEEFANLVKTGAFKPVKMALGGIKDGHEDSKPLGVITNLTIIGNKIVALAALWDHEREDDVNTVKEMVNSGKPVNVSWEILYETSTTTNGIQDLLGVALKAATIVGLPAYAGRTQLLAVAAKKWSPAYLEKLPDTSFLHIDSNGTRYFAYRDEKGKIDPSRFTPIIEEIATTSLPENTLKGIRHTVKKLHAVVSADASIMELLTDGDETITEDYTLETNDLQSKVSELETQLALANDTIATKEQELAAALALAEVANTSVKTLQDELNPLRDFKSAFDADKEKDEKLTGIKTKFGELGLTKDDDYFTTNAEKLLSLDANGLDFMLQEMVAFKSEDKGESAASLKTSSGIPNIPAKTDNLSDPKELAAALRERNKK
jgi:hypothetical protein